jgi:zinc transporter, ZIP family
MLAAALLLAVAAATLLGGAVPLRFQRSSRLFLAFSAGTLVGLALLELIPEGLKASGDDPHGPMLLVLVAFVVTMLLEKLHVLHPHQHGTEGCADGEHVHSPLALHGATGLLVHSAVDGLALAAALRESTAAAIAVALALSAHKFADGLTTVSLVLGHRHRQSRAVGMLAGNAGMLAVGFVIGLLIPLGEEQLAALLLIMAGFFLYLGASDLIPSLTTPVCRKRDVLATAAGMAAVAAVSMLAH